MRETPEILSSFQCPCCGAQQPQWSSTQLTCAGCQTVFPVRNGYLDLCPGTHEDVLPIQKLMQLRPVVFRYKQPFADGSKPIQFGLIAEEVFKIYPELVARSSDGQIETVKYQVLDSLLLNEVQRQQKQIEDQRDQIRALRERLEKLEEPSASASPLP